MSKQEKENLAKMKKALKIRNFIFYFSVAVGFISMAADLMITKNIFRHVGWLMILSIFAFGFAIHNEGARKRLKIKIEKIKHGK
jgi:hypothetical protein